MHSKPSAGGVNYGSRLGVAVLDALDRRLKGNILVNGSFAVWYGTTSFASGALLKHTAPCWHHIRDAAAAGGTVSRQTGDNWQYAVRVQRDNANAVTGNLYLGHSVETQSSLGLRNLPIMLKFEAKCGANFSPTSSLMQAEIFYGTGTDQNVLSGFTGSTTLVSESKTLSTSIAVFETTPVTVPVGATQIGVRFYMAPTGTAGANDWMQIQKVQLIVGNNAGEFPDQSMDEDVSAVERFLQQHAIRVPVLASPARMLLPTRMRATPTITGGGAGFVSTNTTLSYLEVSQTGDAVQTLTLDSGL